MPCGLGGGTIFLVCFPGCADVVFGWQVIRRLVPRGGLGLGKRREISRMWPQSFGSFALPQTFETLNGYDTAESRRGTKHSFSERSLLKQQ